MRQKKINELKEYRKVLILYKRIQIERKLDEEVENKFPTLGKEKVKVLTLFNR